MQIEARLKRGWGYGLIIEDNQGKKLGEILFTRELVQSTDDIMKCSECDNRRRVICNLTIDENGIRIDVMPKYVVAHAPFGVDVTTGSIVNINGTAMKVSRKGRPKGAKNKPKKHKVDNETLSQEIMKESMPSA